MLFFRVMYYVDWKMFSNMIVYKNEIMNKVYFYYRLNEMKEKSIVYFIVFED